MLAFTLYTMATFSISMFYFAKYGISPDYFVHTYSHVSKFSLGFAPAPDISGIHEDPVDVRGVAAFASRHPVILAAAVPFIALELGLMFLVLSLVFGIIHWVAYLIGIPTAVFLNRLTADRLRSSAFGNDTIGEQVVQVAPVPEDCDDTFAHLPDDVEKHLSAFCDQKAVVTLERVRDVLGVCEQLPGKGDIATTIANELASYELIHVAYFEVDEFARLVAAALRSEPVSRPALRSCTLAGWWAGTGRCDRRAGRFRRHLSGARLTQHHR